MGVEGSGRNRAGARSGGVTGRIVQAAPPWRNSNSGFRRVGFKGSGSLNGCPDPSRVGGARTAPGKL